MSPLVGVLKNINGMNWSMLNLSFANVSLFRMRPMVAVICTFMYLVPVQANGCNVFLESVGEISVQNNSSVAGAQAMFGFVGGLMASELSSKEISETDFFIQSELKKIDYHKLLEEISLNRNLLNKHGVSNSSSCELKISIKRLNLDYVLRTDISTEINISHSIDGKLVYQNTETISGNLGTIPAPTTPRRTFKLKNNKYIETTKSKLTNEEAFDQFKPNFIQAMSKIFSKLFDRYEKDLKSR